MKLKIKDIGVEGLELQGELNVKAYDLPVDEFKNWTIIHYHFFCSITSKEYLVRGTLQTQMTAPCARCLEPIPLKINIPSFAHSGRFTTLGDVVDLTPYIREDILLALPMAPKCELDAEGRCPYTGVSHAAVPSQFDENQRKSIWGDLNHLS